LYYFKRIYIIVVLLSIVINFTIKDQFYWSSFIFYTFPLPIIILLIIGLLIFIKKHTKKIIVLVLILTVIWISRSYKHNETNINESHIEIVLWNASRDRNFEDAFNEIESIPDILILVECGEKDIKKVKSKYGDNYFFLSKEEIGIFSKTPITVKNKINSENNSTIINFKVRGFNFYAIDLSGSMFNFRKKELDFLFSNIDKSKKMLILGDFNTPFESVHFKDFKDNFNHAFSEKGNGFRETWPWNIPLLSLDHIWASKDLEILTVEKINTFKSDHSILKAVIKN
jgi:Endonuclease/Exonuclease/phosphatase family